MNTGFNLINVPDSPSLLEQKTSKKFGVIDCLQRYFLPSITIRATEDQVIHGDFLKLYDDEDDSKYAYYVINSYQMTSGDTVVLNVAMEPLLTCGGIDNITIVDGTVSRHHLAAGEDIPFEDDPLLVPRKVYLTPVATFFDGDASKKTMLIVRSIISGSKIAGLASANIEDLIAPTVDLEATFDPQTQTLESYTGKMCTQAVMDFGTDYDPTEADFQDYRGYVNFNGGYTLTKEISDGTHYSIVSNINDTAGYKKLGEAVRKCTELGRDDIVLDTYYVPEAFYADESIKTSGGTELLLVDEIHNAINRDLGLNPRMLNTSSKSYKVLPVCGGKKPSEWHNKRILFGSNFAYTFVSPDNNQKLVINPEEFYDPSVDYDIDPEGWSPEHDDDPTPDQFPKVLVSFDLRPDGNITFTILPAKVEYLDGSFLTFERDVSPFKLSTGPWDKASVVTSAVSGGALKARSYTLSSFMKDEAVDVQMRYDIENKSRGLRVLNPFADFSTGVHRGYYMGDRGGGAFDPATNLGMSSKKVTYNNMSGLGSRADAYVGATTGNEYDKARYDRISQRMQENMEFANAMIPKTQVVSKASGSALMNGHGMIVYRNFVSEEDLEKFDRILNKYGCKHTTLLTHDMLTNRPLFNYIETQGVSIKCSTVPKSVRDELANAFNTGLRIWHVKDVNVNAWNDPVEEES